MAEYTDSLNKIAGSELDGESFIAAIKCVAKGQIRRQSFGAGFFGAAGALAGASSKRSGHEVGGEPLPNQLALGATSTRLFLFGLSKMTSKATTPARAIVPLHDVSAVERREGKTFGMKQVDLDITFRDGTTLSVEIPRVSFAAGELFADTLRDVVNQCHEPDDSAS